MVPGRRCLRQVLTHDADLLAHVKYHPGFMGMRLGSVAALAFHPNNLVLAAGTAEYVVSIFGVDESQSDSD